ncbi:MAG: pilus assembly protein [Alphaproteobacteria bacterium]|nr:pilus assembly protein [Alphaproteobacteria bacterium]
MAGDMVWLKRTARWRHAARRGATAVEMAIIAPVFFMMLMGTVEMCLMMGAQQILENAAFNTARLAKTGYTGSGETQAQTVTQILDNELKAYGSMLDPNNVTVTETAYSDFSNAGTNTGGTSGYGTQQQIVAYTFTYPWKLFTPMMSEIIGTNGIVNLTSTIVVRNEPYG